MSTNTLLLLLLTETFDTPSDATYAYSDEGASFFATLASLTAEEASKSLVSGGTTIAGHADHVRFFTEKVFRRICGHLEPIDWSGAWLVREVSADEWTALQQRGRSVYEELKTYLETHADLEPINERRAMAIVVHAAYHVGAIRQMMQSVQTL